MAALLVCLHCVKWHSVDFFSRGDFVHDDWQLVTRLAVDAYIPREMQYSASRSNLLSTDQTLKIDIHLQCSRDH